MPEPKPKKTPAPAKPGPPPQAAAAYDDVEPEMEPLGDVNPRTVNIDIPLSVSIVLGVLPGLRELRADIQKKLPEHDLKQFDRLEKYALAAWYAHVLSLPPASPASPLKDMVEEAKALKTNLLSDATALARRGMIQQAAVDLIRSGQGNVDLANDLVALYATFTGVWKVVESKTAATLEEVQRAGELGPALLAAVGIREHGPEPGSTEAVKRRLQAATLFMRAYDQTRRAVAYLRWDDGDEDEIAPSLYKGRGGRGSGAKAGAKEETPVEAPATGGEDQGASPKKDE